MHWDVYQILDAVADGFEAVARQHDLEQAVYGIDALDELGLHPLIRNALLNADFGVWPEQRFPSDRGKKPSRRRRKSEGQRCDIVLTRHPDQPLVDPEAEATLFAPPDSLSLEAAFWLEIKTVSQYTTEGPFAHYGKELLNPVARDIRKLASDRLIFNSALLLVLFNESEETAQHDIAAWEKRSLQKGYPVGAPIVRSFPITDRLGNAHTSIILVPVRRL